MSDSTPSAEVPVFDLFAELEAEIKVSLAKSERIKRAEELRKAANNRFASKESREISRAEYNKLREELEAATWETDAYYAMFTEQTCDGCGSVHRTFLQYMAHQFNLRTRSATRFTPIRKPNGVELPRHVMVQPLATHICSDCCDEHGFYLTQKQFVMRENGVITVASMYEQEDINDAES